VIRILVLATLLGGCATTRPLTRSVAPSPPTYPGISVSIKRFIGDDYRSAEANVRKDIQRSRIRSLGVSADGEETAVAAASRRVDRALWATLPPPVLLAVDSIPCATNPGLELDLLVGEGQKRRPVTLWCRTGHDVDVAWGELVSPLDLAWDGPESPAERATALAERFDVGPILNGEREWSHQALNSLQAVLEALPAAELAALRGLPLVRDVSPSKLLAAAHAAYYEQGESGSRIVILNETFDHDGIAFVGSPTAPVRISVATMAHEIGHALARASSRTVVAELDDLDAESLAIYTSQNDAHAAAEALRKKANRAINTLNARVDERNAKAEAYNTAVETYRSRRDRASQRVVESLSVELEALDADVAGLRTRAEDLRRRQAHAGAEFERLRDEVIASNATLEAKQAELDALLDASPMLAAFSKLPGAGDGPTIYGRTSLEESFAEAYALHRFDPEALERVAPEMQAWFAAGEHLRLIEQRDTD